MKLSKYNSRSGVYDSLYNGYLSLYKPITPLTASMCIYDLRLRYHYRLEYSKDEARNMLRLQLLGKKPDMYSEFTIKLGVHITNKDAMESCIQAAREAAQLWFTQGALLSNTTPDLELTIENNTEGTRKIKVFD